MNFQLIALALIVLALAFVLIPLLRSRNKSPAPTRDEANAAIYRRQRDDLDADLSAGRLTSEQHASAVTDLEERLLQDVATKGDSGGLALSPARRWPVIAVSLAIPLIAFGLYRYLGAPTIMDTDQMRKARASHDTDAMVRSVEARLAKNPDDAEGWLLLGQAYVEMKKLKDADEAMAKAVNLAPKDAGALAHYAEVLAMRNGNDLQGRPQEMLAKALELAPENEKALELSGLAAYQRQDWAQASFFWRQLLKRLPAQSEFRDAIEVAIKDVDAKAAAASGLGDKAVLKSGKEPKAGAPH